MLQEGVTWFGSPLNGGIYFEVTVIAPAYPSLLNSGFDLDGNNPIYWSYLNSNCSWNIRSDNPQNGSYYLSVNKDSSNNCNSIYQDVPYAPVVGDKIRLGVWIRPSSNVARQINLVAFTLGGAQEYGDHYYQTYVSQWQCIETELNIQNIGHTAVRAQMYLESGDTQPVWVDDFIIQKGGDRICPKVGDGTSRSSLFQNSWSYNDSISPIGYPIDAVYWWPNDGSWSRDRVTRQDMVFVGARGNQVIFHDEPADIIADTVRAYVVWGAYVDLYLGNSDKSYRQLGAPTSNQFWRCNNESQSFDNGYLLWNSSNPTFTPWNENQPNWKVEFWNNKAMLAGRTYVGSYPAINFDWATNVPVDINGCDLGLFPDQFSMRATQTVYFPQGPYVFNVEADDGVRLYVDNALVMDHWVNQPATKHAYTATFASAGNHTIRMEYFEDGGNALAKLSWASADTSYPTGNIAYPVNNSTASKYQLNITANANDTGGSGVNRVEFYAAYDGGWHLLCTDYTAPYSCLWDNTGIENQGVTLTLHAIDNAGNRTQDPGGYVDMQLQHRQVFVPSTQKAKSAGW